MANRSDSKVWSLALMIFQELFVECPGSKVAHRSPEGNCMKGRG